MNNRKLLIGLVLLILAAIVAYVAWNRHQTKQLQNTALSQIDHATRALRAALTPAAQAQAIAASATQVDQELTALRTTGTARIPLLAAGADSYLVTARELLRRQAIMQELQVKIGSEIIAFRDHLLSGNRRAANWTTEAVQLKNRLEQDFREYQRTVEAHTKIAEGYPDVRKSLAGLVPDSQLMSLTEITAARDAALSAAKTLTGEVEAARGIAAPR